MGEARSIKGVGVILFSRFVIGVVKKTTKLHMEVPIMAKFEITYKGATDEKGRRLFIVKNLADEMVSVIPETKNGDGYRLFLNPVLGYQKSINLSDETLAQMQTGFITDDFEIIGAGVTKARKKIEREIKTGVSLDGDVYRVWSTLLKLEDVEIVFGEETLKTSEILELLKIQALANYENHKDKYEKQVKIERKKAEMERLAKELAELEKEDEEDEKDGE